MTKRFVPNLSGVSAGIPVLENGDFEFVIGEVKAFSKPSQKDGIDVLTYGIRTSLKVVEGASHVGKTVPFTMYLHSEEAQPMVKQFLMAAYGYGRNTEAEFNEKFASEDDWFVDLETTEIGEVYKGLTGQRVLANVRQRPSKQDPNIMQNQFTWAPA